MVDADLRLRELWIQMSLVDALSMAHHFDDKSFFYKNTNRD